MFTIPSAEKILILNLLPLLSTMLEGRRWLRCWILLFMKSSAEYTSVWIQFICSHCHQSRMWCQSHPSCDVMHYLFSRRHIWDKNLIDQINHGLNVKVVWCHPNTEHTYVNCSVFSMTSSRLIFFPCVRNFIAQNNCFFNCLWHISQFITQLHCIIFP